MIGSGKHKCWDFSQEEEGGWNVGMKIERYLGGKATEH